jgi:hypothetical protein
MTPVNAKPQEPKQVPSAQQRHTEAALLLELASKYHMEAAQHYATGDEMTALNSARLANENLVRALKLGTQCVPSSRLPQDGEHTAAME